MLYPDRVDGVRQQPGRLRDGLRVLRHRPGRLRPPPHRRRDRRAGRARRRARRGRWTGGSATSCSWAWASRSPTRPPCGRRSSACTTTSACRPATSPISTVGLVPGIRRLDRATAAGQPRRVAARRQRRAARRAGADQQALPDRRADRRRAPTTSRPRVAGCSFEWAMIDGVNDRASDAAELAELCRRLPPAGPRQPDPAEPDARLPDRRLAAAARARVPRPARDARRQRDGAAQPRHRHRRRLRPARRRSTGGDQPVTVTPGTSGWPPPACRAPTATPTPAPPRGDRRAHRT